MFQLFIIYSANARLLVGCIGLLFCFCFYAGSCGCCSHSDISLAKKTVARDLHSKKTCFYKTREVRNYQFIFFSLFIINVFTTLNVMGIIDLSLRSANFVFYVIALGLTGSLAAGHATSRINFAVFASAWGVLFSLYGIAAGFVEQLAWPLLITVIEFLNFVFSFAAATALAAGLRVHSCTNQSYLDSNNIANGETGRCREAQAAIAFLYFAFFSTLVLLGLAVVSLSSGGAFGRKTRASKGGVPTISTA